MASQDEIRAQIFVQIEQYFQQYHARNRFMPGVSHVPVSGKVYDHNEMMMLVDSALDFWLTTGRFNDQFEAGLKNFIGVKHLLTVNSGSSADLLAMTALTSHVLDEARLQAGDEIITVAAGFPTTVNPIIQNNLTPVFVDIDIPTYNVNTNLLENALSEKTRGVIFAHTLGNPFNIEAVQNFTNKHKLWMIEDCCDALGSTYSGQLVGTFGDIGTCSFYPAHHITMGEGGAVFTNNAKLKRVLLSIRDWGRDCHCDPGKDNTCNKRFDWQLGNLPRGYDHKYIYSHIGYNLKITDMQAAVGLAQLSKLDGFIKTRKENFKYLKSRLREVEDYFILPEATEHSDPSWFGFPVTIRPSESLVRQKLLTYLNQRNIGTRLLFGGNLTKQPYFKDIKYRTAGSLENTDLVMLNTFWLGVYPGISTEMLDYVADSIIAYIKSPKEQLLQI